MYFFFLCMKQQQQNNSNNKNRLGFVLTHAAAALCTCT